MREEDDMPSHTGLPEPVCPFPFPRIASGVIPFVEIAVKHNSDSRNLSFVRLRICLCLRRWHKV
jgi:hypothetical protein